MKVTTLYRKFDTSIQYTIIPPRSVSRDDTKATNSAKRPKYCRQTSENSIMSVLVTSNSFELSEKLRLSSLAYELKPSNNLSQCLKF